MLGSLNLHITRPWKIWIWKRFKLSSHGAPPGIAVEQMERSEVQSKLRNPVLAGLLSYIPGYIEQIGSGIRFMLDETKRMELPAPQFREMSEFIVTFQKAPALRAPEPQVQYK